MIWDISPIAFTLSVGDFHLAVRWYGLFFASTFLYGIIFFRYMYRKEGRPPDEAYDLALYVIAGSVLGARLGHVLFYNPEYYFSHPLKILALGEGGLSSHGGGVGILLSVWLYARHATNQSFSFLCDHIALAIPFSGFLIRLGNFFNSEILGTPADIPWAVIFARVDIIPRHPVQLYEALCYLIAFAFQLRYYLKRGNAGPQGFLLGRFFIFVFGARFFLEFFKEEQAAFADGWALTMGQWLSVPAVVAGFWLVWRAKRAERLGNI